MFLDMHLQVTKNLTGAVSRKSPSVRGRSIDAKHMHEPSHCPISAARICCRMSACFCFILACEVVFSTSIPRLCNHCLGGVFQGEIKGTNLKGQTEPNSQFVFVSQFFAVFFFVFRISLFLGMKAFQRTRLSHVICPFEFRPSLEDMFAETRVSGNARGCESGMARVRLADLNGTKWTSLGQNGPKWDHFGLANAKIWFGIRSF